MPRIVAIVKNVSIYLDHPESPTYDPEYVENQLKDMCRYDACIIEQKRRVNNEVHVRLKCHGYRPRRWLSFGIETRKM